MAKPKWMNPPDNISAGAKKYWKAFLNELSKAERLDQRSRPAFLQMCVCMDLVDQAAAELSTAGPTVRSASGSLKANPAMVMMVEGQKQVDQLKYLFWPAPKGPFDL